MTTTTPGTQRSSEPAALDSKNARARALRAAIAACASRECRINQYLAAYRGGYPAMATSSNECTNIETVNRIISEPGCPAIYWCPTTVHELDGQRFTYDTEERWFSTSPADLVEVAKLRRTHSYHHDEIYQEETSPYPHNAFGISIETLHSSSGYMDPECDEDETENRAEKPDREDGEEPPYSCIPPTEEIILKCHIVYIDSCTARIGYVCPVDPDDDDMFDDEGTLLPPDQSNVYELELKPSA